jgi:hypothetical protein
MPLFTLHRYGLDQSTTRLTSDPRYTPNLRFNFPIRVVLGLKPFARAQTMSVLAVENGLKKLKTTVAGLNLLERPLLR